MPNKIYFLEYPDLGKIKVSKKHGLKSFRVRIDSKSNIFVSVPYLTPNVVVDHFIKSKKKWIEKNRPNYNLKFFHKQEFKSGITLGIYDYQAKNRSKVIYNRLNIYLRGSYNQSNSDQVKYIEKCVIKAMKTKAENEILPKLQEYADLTGHKFNQANIKYLQSRWGSCDSSNNIILNIFLLQLPEYLQKYVILHELTHTVHMNHSRDFWSHLSQYLPDPKKYSKELKNYHTRIETKTLTVI